MHRDHWVKMVNFVAALQPKNISFSCKLAENFCSRHNSANLNIGSAGFILKIG